MRHFLISGLLAAGLSACTGVPGDHSTEIHGDHTHVHGDGCGHAKVWHVDHWDYLHDGHLHFVHEGHVDEHVLEVSDVNPVGEAPMDAALHAGHMHGADDTHMMVPHGDHFDYIHDGHLHYVHGDHVDDHGPVTVEENS
ncbi:MAG: hypothetical protein AAFN91_18870 [Pseudomonadota bacterium]